MEDEQTNLKAPGSRQHVSSVCHFLGSLLPCTAHVHPGCSYLCSLVGDCGVKQLAFPSGDRWVNGMSHPEARWDVWLQLGFLEAQQREAALAVTWLLLERRKKTRWTLTVQSFPHETVESYSALAGPPGWVARHYKSVLVVPQGSAGWRGAYDIDSLWCHESSRYLFRWCWEGEENIGKPGCNWYRSPNTDE